MSDPSSLARQPDQLDVFRVGADGRVYTAWWHNGFEWGGWGNIGGFFPPAAEVSSVARTPDNLDLFICGNDGRVYTSWWWNGGSWSGAGDNWRSIGGFFPPGAPVSSVARYPNHLDLFITGNDGRVYTSWWHEGQEWSGINDNWSSLGGFFPPGAPVTVVARNPDQLDLFITGNDGRVYTSWWNPGGGWSGVNDNWRAIGGFFPPGAKVSVVSRYPDHLDLFVSGNDGRIYTSWWHQGQEWSGINDNWMSLGGFFPVGSHVGAVARNPDQLDLFVSGNDGRIYTSWWNPGGGWSGVNDNWRSIGGFFPPGASVSAVGRYPDHLDLFVRGNDDQIYSSWWHQGFDWSGVNDNWFVVPPSIRLNFTMEMQPQTNWCWAATSRSVAAYYDPATPWTQCEIANQEKGQTTCCVNGSSAACNSANVLDSPLTRVGHLDHVDGRSGTFAEMWGQMRLGRPVAVRTAWSGGGAHFLCIIGCLAGGFYAVDDPIFGKSDVAESTFGSAYQGSGSWTHTYYTR